MAKVDETVVGICGNCGWEVVVPVIFMSTVRPKPKCNSCGLHAASLKPTVEMDYKTGRGQNGQS